MAEYINSNKISEYFRVIHGNIAIGADGYIDEVWQPLDFRNSLEELRMITEDYA